MKYEMEGRIRYSETDETGRLSLGGLINYFQDCSTFQTEHLGVGIGYLKQKNQAWILSSWQIVLQQMPKLGEAVRVDTWAYEFQGFYGLRNFTLTGGDGQIAACANSVWVLFDTARQRPVRIPASEAALYDPEPCYDGMDYAPRKIALPAKEDSQGQLQIRQETPVTVTRQLLDTNHHVNNGQYISIAQAFLPDNFKIGQVRAEYRQQARLGDEMLPVIYERADEILIALRSAAEPEKIYALVAFTAQQRSMTC